MPQDLGNTKVVISVVIYVTRVQTWNDHKGESLIHWFCVYRQRQLLMQKFQINNTPDCNFYSSVASESSGNEVAILTAY